MPAYASSSTSVSGGAPRRVRRWFSLLGLIGLMAASGAGLRQLGGGPHPPPALPSLDVVRAALSGSTIPIDVVVYVLVSLTWLIWLWIVGSLGLELLIMAAEAITHGASWVGSLRRLGDRVSVPLVRRVVATAFAVQVLSRGVPVAAAAPVDQAELTFVVAAQPGPSAQSASDVDAAQPVYRVKTGDNLWSIAQAVYGSGTEYRRLLDANVGRRMPDGQLFPAHGVLQPGWELVLPDAPGVVEESDGARWYTVSPGDTLCGIAARVLHDESRWAELLELNRGAASPDGVHTFKNPDIIWPGLRLRLPHADAAAPADPEPPSEVQTHPAQPSPDTLAAARAPAAIAEPEGELTAAAAPVTVSALIPPTEEAPPPLLRAVHPVQPVALESPVPTSQAEDPTLEPAPQSEDSTAESAAVELPTRPLLAGGLTLAALAAAGATYQMRRRRRLRPLSREPESDVVVEGGYASAELTHEFTRGLQGGGFDPVSAIVDQLRRFLAEYSLEHVGIVTVRHGRSSTSVTLAAGPSEQGLLLDLAPEFAARLDSDAEAVVTPDDDVLLRLVRLRKSKLLPSAHATGTVDDLCIPLGALPDHQIFSGAWSALGHVLIASLPGHGSDVILTSLLATLAARCSPDQLEIWTVADARALPAPIADMPHVRRAVDPADTKAVGGLLDDLRHELHRRARASAQPAELVLAIAELSSLSDRANELELLMTQAAALGVRVIAACGTPDEAIQSPLVSQFATRMVLHMNDEAASISLLGVADAAFIGGGGRLMIRIDGRQPLELFGFQVSPEHLERLVRVMRNAYSSSSMSLAPERTASGETPPEPTASAEAPPDPATREPEATETPSIDARTAVSVPASDTAPADSTSHSVITVPIQVYCFGEPRVLYQGNQVWPGNRAGDAKPWEFLLYMACHPPDGMRRDEVTEALWPEDDSGSDPGPRLRQLRYRLRQLLAGGQGVVPSDGIVTTRGALHVDPGTVYSDAQEFLQLVRSARISVDVDETTAKLQRARSLFVGDLLDTPDMRRYAWVEERDASGVTLREHFRRLYQSATDALADLFASADQLAAATNLRHELTEINPGDEHNWQALFHLHAKRGDRPALLREERRMRVLLRELAGDADAQAKPGIDEPSRETQREFERLLAELDARERQAAAV